MTTPDRYYIDHHRHRLRPAQLAAALDLSLDEVETYLAENPAETSSIPDSAGLAIMTPKAAGTVPSHMPNANPIVCMTGHGASR